MFEITSSAYQQSSTGDAVSKPTSSTCSVTALHKSGDYQGTFLVRQIQRHINVAQPEAAHHRGQDAPSRLLLRIIAPSRSATHPI
jgi:hypothetical protein